MTSKKIVKVLQRAAYPVLFFIGVILLWQVIVAGLSVSPLIMPSPLGILKKALADPKTVIDATWVTATQATCGFALSLVVGVAIAITFSQSHLFRLSAFPFAIAFQTIPIISIAPLIILWFDRGFAAIAFVSFLIALFPIITNTTSGLINIPIGQQHLLRLYKASRLQTLWKLQLPSAMPSFVNGAKVSAGLSVLGAIVGEYFAGNIESNRGIGYWIYDSKTIRLEQLFVYVFASTLLGVAMFSLVSIVGDKILLRWQDPNVNQSE